MEGEGSGISRGGRSGRVCGEILGEERGKEGNGKQG